MNKQGVYILNRFNIKNPSHSKIIGVYKFGEYAWREKWRLEQDNLGQFIYSVGIYEILEK